MKLLRLAPLMLLMLVGCATASKQTRVEYLVGNKALPGHVTEATIRQNLVRGATVQGKVKVKNSQGWYIDSDQVESTQTNVYAYPYTEPLIREISKNIAADAGARQKWTAEKTAQFASETGRNSYETLVKKQQCFFMQFSAYDKNANDLDNWKATLKQGKKIQPMKLTAEKAYAQTHTGTLIANGTGLYNATNYEYKSYDQTAIACAADPIDLTETFSVDVETNYKAGLQPLTLAWTKPPYGVANKTNAPAASQAEAEAPKPAAKKAPAKTAKKK